MRALIDRAYVPWSREVLEAADLGALKVQPQMAELKRALATAAAAWGAGLEESVIFVGRLRAPLHVPADGAGEFILNPHQEVFAFTPVDRPLPPAHGRGRPRRRGGAGARSASHRLRHGGKAGPRRQARRRRAGRRCHRRADAGDHDRRSADPHRGRRPAARDCRHAPRVRLPHRRGADERAVRGRRHPDAGSPGRRQAPGRAARRLDGRWGVAGRFGGGSGRLSRRCARPRNQPAEDAPSCFRHVGNRRERSAARSVRAWPDFRSRKRVVTYADEQKIAAAHR